MPALQKVRTSVTPLAERTARISLKTKTKQTNREAIPLAYRTDIQAATFVKLERETRAYF